MANAIMINGLGKIKNYFENIEYSAGFIASDGGIGRATQVQKEVYCEEYFDSFMFQNKIILLGVSPTVSGVWGAIGLYDSEKNFTTRSGQADIIKTNIGYFVIVNRDALYNYPYFRITMRGYGNPQAYAFDMDEMI